MTWSSKAGSFLYLRPLRAPCRGVKWKRCDMRVVWMGCGCSSWNKLSQWRVRDCVCFSFWSPEADVDYQTDGSSARLYENRFGENRRKSTWTQDRPSCRDNRNLSLSTKRTTLQPASMRITLEKTVENQCEHKIDRVVAIIGIRHFLEHKHYGSFHLLPHVILIMLVFFV
jgi:hypothetical protein